MVKNKSFTLIELLIVIGILAILVVTILITLNPSEAQKKARDAKRMKDLATLQAIVLQYINDGGAPFCTSSHFGGDCESQSAGLVQSQPCNNSWITNDDGTPVNLCKYTNTIPTDPLNSQSGTVINTCSPNSVQNPGTAVAPYLRYWIIMKGSDYMVAVDQESKSNAGRLMNGSAINGCNYVMAKSDPSLWP